MRLKELLNDINLEVNIYKDKNNNVYCKKCNTQIGEKKEESMKNK